MECQICYEMREQIYSVANCEHQFCIDCCIAHINAKTESFADVLCPDSRCKKPFNKNKTLMSRLPQSTHDALTKREEFVYMAAHPELKPCSVVNCQGVVNIKVARKVCSVCRQPHCPKCMKVFHDGPCLTDANDVQMKTLGYQKCPKCSVWVERQEGCTFIDCKCGITFCHTCGVEFSQDPCRLTQIRETELEIRKIISKFKLKPPEQKKYLPFFALKLLLQALLFVGFSLMFCLGCTILIVILMAILIVTSPFILIAIACTFQRREAILFVLLFPFALVLFIVTMLLLFLLYPALRNRINHHGIYDGFDTAINVVTKIYLKCVAGIFGFEDPLAV